MQPSDLLKEQLVDLSYPHGLPIKRHPNTYRAWARKGFQCHDGIFVFLETVSVGRVRYTSLEALERFANEVTAHCGGQPLDSLDQ